MSRLLTRVAGAVVVVWIAITVAFVAVKLIPGDPVDVMLGPLATVSVEMREQIRSELGLDSPAVVQYLSYLGNLVTGNLGNSYQLNQPVGEILVDALLPTIQLATGALVIAGFFVALGIFLRHRRGIGRFISVTQVVAVTLPVFWIGYLLLVAFSFSIPWFPATTSDSLASLVLPSVALAIPVSGIIGQVIRSGMSDADTRRWALSVRARGVSERQFDTHHAARHGVIAVTPLTAQIVGGLLGGTILVEQVFSRPGLGSVALSAIANRDMPVILGFVALSACLFAVLSILADLALWMLDPRTRGEGVARA